MKPLRDQLHENRGWGGRLASPTPWIIGIAAAVLLVGVILMPLVRQMEEHSYVTIYTSQDKIHAEQLFRRFTRETGIEVRAVYDSEAVKAVGIANRLLAEKNHPQCDVFWNNEEMRTRQLSSKGVFDPRESWKAFGYRSRRIVVNTNLVSVGSAPKTFAACADPVWAGKIAMAYPLYGMTSTHFMALRDAWGGVRWREWCRALQANGTMIVDGNSVVVRQVGRGEAAVGMTDIDDIKAGQRQGYPIAALPIAEDALLVPNTVALVAGAPHPANGRAFIEWILQRAIQEKLLEQGALEGFDRSDASAPGLNPDWGLMLDNLELATEELSGIFLR